MNERLYWRVVNRSSQRDDPEVDLLALQALVEAFAEPSERAHVRLLEPPSVHVRGGYSLQIDLKADDKASLVEFLHASGWAGVV